MLTATDICQRIKESQKTLFILCGLPYSGKSYLAGELRKCVDIDYVSIDDIFYNRGFNWDTGKLPNAEEWDEIFEESYSKVSDAIEQGRNVLYDSTNHTAISRDKLREVATAAGGVSEVIFVPITEQELWNRWESAKLHKERHIVARELIEKTLQMFETPSEDEAHITLLV